MKKIILSAQVVLLNYVIGFSQVTVSQGTPANFQIQKQSYMTSFVNGNEYYFIFRNEEPTNKRENLVVLDQNGNATYSGEFKMDYGVFNNQNSVNSALPLGNKAVVLVENPNKGAGKNTLFIGTMDNKGVVSKEAIEVDFDFKKMMNHGQWYSYLTPDKQHLAILGELPLDKEQPAKYKFYFFDANLKQLNTGEFDLPGKIKKSDQFSFYANDKGDFYLIKGDYDKGDKIPVVYKTSVSSSVVNEYKVSMDETKIVLSYTASFDPSGDLIIAGYYHGKETFLSGKKAVGVWVYNSAKSTDITSKPFDTPIEDLAARGIVYNGNTVFLIGEQYKESSVMVNTAAGLKDDFTYTHNNLLITGLDNTNWNKKFNIVLNRNWVSKNFNVDISPAFGILNGKLAVVYNDQYGKYFKSSSQDKLPVLVFINNDGLMEQPINFAKELPAFSSFTLFPKYFNNSKTNEMMLLGGNYETIKGIIFRPK